MTNLSRTPARILVIALAASLLACSDESAAPLLSGPRAGADQSRDRYLVVLKERPRVDRGEAYVLASPRSAAGAAAKVRSPELRPMVAALRTTPDRTYERALVGFAGRLAPDEVDALRANPAVAYVEPVQAVEFSQAVAWGVDRLDQRSLPLSGSYAPGRTGAGVRAYIIDSGIRLTHREFTGRLLPGYDIATPGGNASDCFGHGTHVAGIVGGKTFGVARGVTLVPVRVGDCAGSSYTHWVVGALDYVIAQKQAAPTIPMVANISMTVPGISEAIDDAVTRATQAGVVVVTAAGNWSSNACDFSPGRASSALTVGATLSNDAGASYSNHGACVDIHAPGGSVPSAWYTTDSATASRSGTSMAAPHVAGVAALQLEATPTASAATVSANVVAGATPGVLTALTADTPNRLAYAGASAPSGGNQAPDAVLAVTCGGLLCTVDMRGSTDDGGIVSYGITYGDGGSYLGPNAVTTRKYSRAAAYALTAVATDASGLADTAAKSVVVTDAKPKASAVVSSVARRSVNFSATGSSDDGGIKSFRWLRDDDTSPGSASTLSLAFPTDGTYRLRVVVSDSIAQADTASVTVTVRDAPPVAVAAVSCVRRSCTYTSAGSSDDGPGMTLAWRFFDGTVSTATTFKKVYATDGTYAATLTATDQIKQVSTDTETVTATDRKPTAVATATCVRRSCTFNAKSSTDDGVISAFEWKFVDGSVSASPMPVRTYPRDSTETATLTARDDVGQSNTTTLTIRAVDKPPTADFTTTCTTVRRCTHRALTVSTDDGEIVAYAWSFFDGTTSTYHTPSITYPAAGAYTVVLSVTDNAGQKTTISRQVAVP